MTFVQITCNEYDANNMVIDTQNIVVGPCDDGWVVDVLKASAPEASRAVLTLPKTVSN